MGNEQKLKIVKWTAGLDHSVVGRAKQLYPAFGDDLSDMPHDEFNRLWHDADQTVIDCIRRNNFKFGGFYHQGGESGTCTLMEIWTLLPRERGGRVQNLKRIDRKGSLRLRFPYSRFPTIISTPWN